ncbi:3-deoxy-8-phosphooctulonate synthase [Nostoc sp. RF31YmG]|nr:3-deoxy-8-phosphooctulonate synthase [Nostoc sp. RF31YmG]
MIQAKITKDLSIGDDCPLTLIGGPLLIESEEYTLEIAEAINLVCVSLGVQLIFKSSFDKGNRSSVDSFRGLSIKEGLRILQKVKDEFGIPVLTDIHEPFQAKIVAEVVDVIQIPALLCRQTDLLLAAANTGLPVSVKKGQFLAPGDMKNVVEKLEYGGTKNILTMERGTCFGYGSLVVDYRSLSQMRSLGYPVIFDITNSLEKLKGMDIPKNRLKEQHQSISHLARAAAAVGCDGFFVEICKSSEVNPSAGTNRISIDNLEEFLKPILNIRDATSLLKSFTSKTL